jgi:alcohol dehydrogenase, propanol-preferring
MMKVMLLHGVTSFQTTGEPLVAAHIPIPEPAEREVLIKVSVCGVCHTELDEIEGRTPPSSFPMVLGHQVVGTVVEQGQGVSKLEKGDRVGIAWIHSACGRCTFCLSGRENLCAQFQATGRDAFGGYAEYTTVSEDYAYPIPETFSDREAAPLLCAGAVGYRSLRLAGLEDGDTLGLVGFGASAHLVIQLARFLYPSSKIFVFARSAEERAFAGELGAFWRGDMGDTPPEPLKAAIDTTPVWKPVVEAMKHLERGGRLVINAIRKEERDKAALMELDYPSQLWLEKEIKSVANVTRKDTKEFLGLAAAIPIRPQVEEYSLEEANVALRELKERKIRGAKVLIVSEEGR